MARRILNTEALAAALQVAMHKKEDAAMPSILHPKTEIVSNVCAEECVTLLKNFFKGKRK